MSYHNGCHGAFRYHAQAPVLVSAGPLLHSFAPLQHRACRADQSHCCCELPMGDKDVGTPPMLAVKSSGRAARKSSRVYTRPCSGPKAPPSGPAILAASGANELG